MHFTEVAGVVTHTCARIIRKFLGAEHQSS